MLSKDEECSLSQVARLLARSEELVLLWSQSSTIVGLASFVESVLVALGSPPFGEEMESFQVDVCRSVIVVAVTLFCYFALFGNRHWRRRRQLVQELQQAKEQLAFLQEKLRREDQSDDDAAQNTAKREIRIFMDGAFDMMHFGHMNAFRLAKSMGTHLIVGVNSDESITACKGAPLMNDDERLTMVESCKFVDQVVPNCPYIMNKEYLDWVVKEYNIDYVVHGDDPCIVDGKDVYATAKETGKFRTIPRTEGVSTTDIVGRMLLLTKEHHMHDDENAKYLGSHSKFLTTNRLLQLFSGSIRSPTKDMRIVYIDGAWDLFHPGHVAMLKATREVRMTALLLDPTRFPTDNILTNFE